MPWLATACWKTWALPSKLVAMLAGRPTSRVAAWIVFDRLAERHAGRQVERDHDRRQLRDVVDRERRRLVGALGHRVERHQRAGRRADHDLAQHLVGVGILRIGLEDHLVGVVGRVDGRDLARAEGRVEQQADLVDRQAEPRGGVAVDRRSRSSGRGSAGRSSRRGSLEMLPHARFHLRRELAQLRADCPSACRTGTARASASSRC